LKLDKTFTLIITYLISFILLCYVTLKVADMYPEYILGSLLSLYAIAIVFVGVVLFYIVERSKERKTLEEYYRWRKQYAFEGAEENWQDWHRRFIKGGGQQ